MTATSVNALRHPSACPIQVATGTPTTLATESPIITIATALARLPGSARWAATSAATPKYAPCGRPATNREATNSLKLGAKTVPRFPRVKATISASNNILRGTRAARAAMVGAPTTTPSAYAEIMWPAEGSEIPIVVAMSGNRPIDANSVVPIPKPPMDSANIASLRRVECGR